MVFSFQQAVDLGGNGGTTNNFSATMTISSNTFRFLVVALVGSPPAGPDDITSVNFAGSPMTALPHTASPGSNQYHLYLYFQENPTTGLQTFAATCTAVHLLYAVAVEYQNSVTIPISQPDSSVDFQNNVSGFTSNTVTINTVSDQTFAVLGMVANDSPSDVYTGSAPMTKRVTGATFGFPILFDTNGPIHPPGTFQMTIQNSSPTNALAFNAVAAAFLPVTQNIVGFDIIY